MKRCWMISRHEITDAKHLRLQRANSVDNLLDVRDRPSLQSTSSRIQSDKVQSEVALLWSPFGCWFRN